MADRMEPVAHAVMVDGRVHKLAVRADVADELACAARGIWPCADIEPLYTASQLTAAVEEERERFEKAMAVARESHQHAADLAARNTALSADMLDMRALMQRMIVGIAHLSEIARQWEPDHSSGADRRGWLLANDAKDDAEKFLSNQAARLLAQPLPAAIRQAGEAGTEGEKR